MKNGNLIPQEIIHKKPTKMLLDSIETKEKILEKFLKIVVFEGWNDFALKQALKQCGIEEKFSNLIFENGCLDVAEFYIESQNKKLHSELSKIENFSSKKIRDKIRISLYLRFEIEKENKIAFQRLSNFYLSLKNLTSLETGFRPTIQAVKSCFKVSDFIWKIINDQSTDFNFYTK
ncbi:MAG: COQ9 family protein, partial [Pelagibacterales bacterium]|nr:COQ9 family protein [Pelagibacterales bacterium]